MPPHHEDGKILLDDLIAQMRKGTDDDSRAAVDALRQHGLWWDGSLFRSNLSGVNLHHADLNGAYLRDADLRDANLQAAHLSRAFLGNANLIYAELPGAHLDSADLTSANLRAANLIQADLHGAKLLQADLRGADLRAANLTNAILTEASLKDAHCGGTVFANVDLSTVKDLESIRHGGPSYISVDTLYRSRGQIPEVFLRGCGVAPEFIEYTRGLFGEKATQFYNCYISYSPRDQDFALRIHHRLYNETINCWLNSHDLKAGKLLAETIAPEIHSRQKLIVCCSEESLTSQWVDREVNSALQEEEAILQQTGQQVSLLLPLDLDGYVFSPDCRSLSAPRLRDRLTADFTDRHDHAVFDREVEKVIRALRTGGSTAPLPDKPL